MRPSRKIQHSLTFVLLIPWLASSCNEEQAGSSEPVESGSTRDVRTVSQQTALPLTEAAATFRQPITSQEEVKRLENIANSLSKQQLQNLLDEFSAKRNSNELRGAFVLLISELARRDPAAALAMFDPTTMSAKEAGWYQVAGILAESDPALIQGWLLADLRKGPAKLQKGLLHLGVDAMVTRLSGAEMVNFYRKLPKGVVEESSMLNRIFNVYATENAAAAERTARDLLDGEALDVAVQNIALTILNEDPEKALRLTETIQDQSRRRSILAMQYRQLAGNDLPGTLARLEKLDRNLVAEIFRGDDGFFGDSITSLIANDDPEKLVNLINGVTVSGSNQVIFERAVSSLTAAGKPGLALEVIDAMPEGGMQGTLYRKYVDEIVTSDPAAAIATFRELPEGENRSHAFATIGKIAGQKRTFEETIETMNDGIPESDRGNFLNGALPFLIDTDPNKVRSFLGSENSAVLQPEARSQTFERLGTKLTSNNPADAREWLESLPEGDQPAAMKGFSRHMVGANVEELVDVLYDLPKNETWATGVRTLVDDLKNSDPVTAADWQDALEHAGFK